VVQEKKLRCEVSLESARRSHLNISSRLLKIATVVDGAGTLLNRKLATSLLAAVSSPNYVF
jgi:hypothetical protein